MTGNRHYLSTFIILVLNIFKNQSGHLAFFENEGGITLVNKYAHLKIAITE